MKASEIIANIVTYAVFAIITAFPIYYAVKVDAAAAGFVCFSWIPATIVTRMLVVMFERFGVYTDKGDKYPVESYG